MRFLTEVVTALVLDVKIKTGFIHQVKGYARGDGTGVPAFHFSTLEVLMPTSSSSSLLPLAETITRFVTCAYVVARPVLSDDGLEALGLPYYAAGPGT